jgi:hypothetical protein
MKLGVATVITDEGIRPDVLAKALEERGFDSLVVAETETLRLLDSIAALTEIYG